MSTFSKKFIYFFFVIFLLGVYDLSGQVLIEKIEVKKKKSVLKDITKDTSVVLNYNENNISFKFKKSLPQASYQLIGYDSVPKEAENIQTIQYSNLDGGSYQLVVNEIGKLNYGYSYKFSINLPFWKKWWFYPALFIYIVSVISAIFYLFFNFRLRQQSKLQTVRHELEIKALRAQMNPHFIFNSMNTIDAYILRKRFIEASDCLQKFSKLIRQILENSENQTISIAQELETLKLYIELEQERFSNSFSYQFDIQPELLEKDYQIPPLLIQPFVENAILHGIRHLTERKGNILLNLSISESLLLCVITDNGIGRKASSEINKQRQESHKSMGVDITMERISSYQALYGDKMETNITDLVEGMRVEIKLPLNTTPDP